MFILGFISAIIVWGLLVLIAGWLTERRERRGDPEYRKIFEGRKWHKG